MSANYRLVHYVANPVLETRVVIAALVQHDRTVEVARAPYIPDSRCLGGAVSEALVRLLLAQLDRHAREGNVTPSLGPHLVVSEPRDIPASVLDRVDWVRSFLPTRSVGKQRGPKRSAAGLRYFRQKGIEKLVHRRFDPAKELPRSAAEHALPTVTHWVRGTGGLLLLEPVVVSRLHAASDVASISAGLTAYRWALDHGRLGAQPVKLAAYVLPDGDTAWRSEILSRLDPDAYEVVDTANASEAERLVLDVRRTAGQPVLQ